MINIETLKDKIDILPDILTTIKENFDKHGEESLESYSGIAGVMIKLFAKDAVDGYFEKRKGKKLEDDGFEIFLKASFAQVEQSLDVIKDKFPASDTQELLQSHLNILADLYASSFFKVKEEEIESTCSIHYLHSYPPIAFVRDTAEEMLRSLDLNSDIIDGFVKDFNRDIDSTLEGYFSEREYNALHEQLDTNQREESELQFLQDMERLGRIGFSADENLTYMPGFASWKKISEFSDYRNHDKIDTKEYQDIRAEERHLEEVEDLINQYFGEFKKNETIKKVLFILSDFGKGKSTFLKHYASELASAYLRRGNSEYFPIYFNLKNFDNKSYNKDDPLGILASYLAVEYGITIDAEYYKQKKFLFLVDSLDESGSIDQRSIDSVMASIKKIQTIDAVNCRDNRIIVTSRPIEEVKAHLESYVPYSVIKDKSHNYFVSLHGFKSSQLNEWMKKSFSKAKFNKSTLSGFSKEIVGKLENDEDIYEVILSKKLLKSSELQRPIFSYMMYKLILSNVDFSAIEKIGIYLSFLNILTKDAKHANDTNYKVNLSDEFNFRNILHYTAVLWQKQKEMNDFSLSKTDICRTIKGEIPDDESKNNCSDISDFKFLSHSYFGNDGDTLYFNHQSFAEMLLAEYYLKVFIKYALDGSKDTIEEARILLSIGTPTEQTMEFFKELLLLFKESADDNDPNVSKKREMLVKFLVSCSVNDNNRVQSTKLYNKWYEDLEEAFKKEEDKTEDLIQKWPISEEEIIKITELARDILMTENTISFSKSKSKNSIFDREVTVFTRNIQSAVPDMDKWIALVVGNTLQTRIVKKYEECVFFNADLPHYDTLFQMVKNWNLHQENSAPSWASGLFKGLKMERDAELRFIEKNSYLDMLYKYDLSMLKLNGLNFSYSNIQNVDFSFSALHQSCFNYCSIENVNFTRANLYQASFLYIKVFVEIKLSVASLGGEVVFPTMISQKFSDHIASGSAKSTFIEDSDLVLMFGNIRGILEYGLEKELFDKSFLLELFDFQDDIEKLAYKRFITSL